ncbi:MAG: SPOR domain-containing protein [Bacteroidetes bacterium]|nr:SPOR domain-containing protein [Bacteroidota bacterium]
MSASDRVAAQNLSQKPEAQEIYLSFNFSGLVNNVVTALYYQDSVYLPIGAIFKQLKVNREIDPRTETVRGFYIKPGDRYEINFKTGIATIGETKITFDSSQAIVRELDFYILPSLFKKIFNLDFSVDFNSLTLILNTNQQLPIVEDYQREVRRNFSVTQPQAGLLQAPLMYPRRRAILNGGVLDYSLSAFYGGQSGGSFGQSAYNYSLDGGAEILGGDAQGTVLGSFSRSGSSLYSSNMSWRYVFDSTRYISYAGLGNLYSNGLTQYGFRGAQISNEPVAIRTIFGRYAIDAKTEPNWDVELYLNGQLVGYAKADASGNAHFTIPLVYGTSFIQLKYYGPTGEFRETDRRLQIPFTFLPAGQINYTVSGGKLNNTDYNFLQGNVVAGLTDWMTDRIGMDYVNSPFYSKPLFYNSLFLRFAPEYMLSLDAAPSAFYRSTFNALYASQASFDLMFARYYRNLLYNPSGKQQEARADVYLPFSIFNSGFNLRVAGNAQQYTSGQKSYSYSVYTSSSVAQFNTSIGYLGSALDYGNGSIQRNYGLTASILYSLFFGPGALSFLNGTLINTTLRYGVLKTSLDDIRLELSQNVQRYVRVTVSGERDFVNKLTTFSLQIIADFPFTRSTTSAQVQQGSGWYTENLTGSVGFDANYGRFLFNDIGWVGHSAASMRMFVDNNGSGKYEKGDEIIKDGVITLRQAVSSETSQGGIIREWNHLPYTQYSADIDINSIRNPLWIPKEKSFSFITDPNSYKRIDIPFYVGGIVDGTVLRVQDGSESAVPGLNLEIRSLNSNFEKTLTVFNDGSFYYMGLPPGEYEAYVDSSQLSMLDVYSEPAVLNFKVKPTKNGDYVEGLQIILRNKKAKETVALPPKPAAVVTIVHKYVVQIGAFTGRDRAVNFAAEAKERTGYKLNVLLNPVSKLYVVQTDTIDNRQDALNELDVFVNRYGYADAFVVRTNERRLNYLFSIQLAAFQSLSAAAEFANEVQRDIGLKPLVQFRRSTRLFSVMVGPFATMAEADKLKDSLNKIPAYSNAFVVIYGESELPKMFAVSLGTFSSDDLASAFADEFRKRTGLVALVDFDSKKMEFRVLTPTYQTESEATALLDKIHSYKGYASAKLISLP